MKNYIRLLYNPLLAAGGVASAAQTTLGLVQSILGNKDMKKYMAQLQPYSTPEEIYDIVNASTARAAGGLSPETLAYLTGEADRGFGASLGAATRLGADPNDLAELYDQRLLANLKIGRENEYQNLLNFDKYIGAKNLLADNKAAEQKSRQEQIYNRIQAAQFNKESGLQNIGSGVNAFLGTLSANETSKLYKAMFSNPNIQKSIGPSVGDPLPPVLSSGPTNPSSVPYTPATPTPDSITDAQLLEILKPLLKNIKIPVR